MFQPLAPERISSSSTSPDRIDVLLLGALIILTFLYSLIFFDSTSHPFEDAAMLMRYAKHLSEGHGIVWNIGDAPLDGATDFLFMVSVAGFSQMGFTIEFSVRFICSLAHILTLVMLYQGMRSFHGVTRGTAFVTTSYLAIGPALSYIAAYFGTPLFAFFGFLSWYFAYKLKENPTRIQTVIFFSCSSLMMALTRPEGVFLVILMAASLVYFCGAKNSFRIVLVVVLLFAVIGGAYFLWRWNYFGHPLPNPFYRKGGGQLHFAGLIDSIGNLVLLSFPFIPMFILGFRNQQSRKETIFAMIPLLGFSLVWILLSHEMNYSMRFQYVLLPMILLSWPACVRGLQDELSLPTWRRVHGRKRWVLVALGLFFSLTVLLYQYRLSTARRLFLARDGRFDVAVMLNQYEERGYVIATTEAGLLPLYSGWKAVDTWGLNDRWIAQNGSITEEYLEKHKPHLIVFHDYFSPLVPPAPRGEWTTMTLMLKNYAEENNYVLAAAYGISPYETHFYYVRPDFPEGQDIVKTIQTMDYYWFEDGKKCVNFAFKQQF